MSSIKNGRLYLGEDLTFETWGNQAKISTRDFDTQLTLEDIGTLSEWLAEAYENIAGEPYAPKMYASGGYIKDEGTAIPAGLVHAGDYIIPKSALAAVGLGMAPFEAAFEAERDCE